ncbi:Spectrin repeat superfamily Extracellular matrix-binding protein, putative [Babesia ovata]|uniref:Spectrin repeat superfamily Extracellular matrix-binding protein, putative n=1 Tax=Babesia ovata TaxID=189622 RepID=A0A2H6KAP1_9APIC|nr:Spectrin repeat superfamily Extracellular matrix-binding protein, putative [Babesia ovata]GBE60058.1 Spectrin repeat superfamily Extracellular matrix-binding protein, putative [Babesia ovata]
MVRQPKKLTDCPENLRESIDWLIQVKHGNGGEGLKNLADALKKLINEAITKATTSLQHKSHKLSCSPNPHDPLSYCSTLDKDIKSKNEELKNAKNSNNTSEISSLESQINDLKSNKDDCTKSHFMDGERMSSLEAEVHDGIDVIVKLTQFSGGEDSIVTLIEKEIERLEKQHNDCEKSPQPHASSDCPQHKLLEELKEKRETLSQNNSNCETLLNNLCTGLEKFLGFSNGSATG